MEFVELRLIQVQTRPVSSPAGSRWTSSKPFPSSCPQTRANYSRGTGLFAVSNFPRLRVGQESCDNSFPRLRVGQESCDNSFLRLRVRQESRDFPSRGSAWGKNRVIFLPAAPREARIVPRNLAAIRERQESRRETLPPSGLGQETVFLASRRVIWVKKQCF